MTMHNYDKTKCQSDFFKGYSGCQCSYCQSYKNLPSRWVVNIFGDETHSEISVVRENNRHGRASWGWFDKDKKFVFGHDDWQGKIDKNLFNSHIRRAEKYALRLNDEEDTSRD